VQLEVGVGLVWGAIKIVKIHLYNLSLRTWQKMYYQRWLQSEMVFSPSQCAPYLNTGGSETMVEVTFCDLKSGLIGTFTLESFRHEAKKARPWRDTSRCSSQHSQLRSHGKPASTTVL
jgi:hypothetical protein